MKIIDKDFSLFPPQQLLAISENGGGLLLACLLCAQVI